LTIAAFFDMDRTILDDSSGMLYLRYLMGSGRVGLTGWLKVSRWFAGYYLGLVDFPRAMVQMLLMSTGPEEEALKAVIGPWFEEWVAPHISEAAVARIEEHRAAGHHLVVLSAASVYVVRPLADRLNIPDVLCTYLEVESGRFTGNLLEPAAYRSGKALLAQQFAAKRNIDLQQSTFYSDGHEDMPMLELVGNPVAINPDRKLERVASERGWPIEKWY